MILVAKQQKFPVLCASATLTFKFFAPYRQKRKENVHPKMTAEEITKVN